MLSNVVGHRRTGQHPFGGSNRVLPDWRTQIVCHAAPPGRKNKELLQWVFFDGRKVVPDERLLCYPTRNDTVSQTNVLSFARINVISARMLGDQLPP